MRNYLLIFAFLVSQLLAINSLAGQNPVAWSLTPSTGFPAATTNGSTYAVSYRLSNNLSFPVALNVSSAYTGGSFAIDNGCNVTLAAKGQPNDSCLVHISLQPIAARLNQITLTLAYGNNRVPLPTLSTTSSSNETNDKMSGHVTTKLPPLTYKDSSYPVGFTFTNNGQTTITATSIVVNGFTADTPNQCENPLLPAHSCTVTGAFIPTSTGIKTLMVTYNYATGFVPLMTTTVVENSSGPCHHVDARATLPLPANSFTYADNVVKYTFTNYCSTAETLGAVVFSADGDATITKGQDTCSNATLSADGGTCSVYASVVPTAANSDLSVIAMATYNGGLIPAMAVTSSAIAPIPSPTQNHTVYFVNQCDQNVWYEFANNAGAGRGDPTPAGQRTYSDYQMPAQLTGAAPSTKTLTFPAYVNGGIYGRTLCDPALGYCKTANCTINSPNDWSCKMGVGALPPSTALEEYMPDTTNSDGVYDVSLINGFNLPAEMKSLAPINPNNNVFTQACGQAAGAVIQPAGSILGNSSWSFDPSTSGDPASNFIWVAEGSYSACASSSACGANEYCGTAFASLAPTTGAGTPPLNQRCGAFRGYWQVQAFNDYPNNSQWDNGTGANNLYTYYNLGGTLAGYCSINGSTATVYDMYTCPDAGQTCLLTGYDAGHPKACGCVNYSFTGSASSCVSPNLDWIARVYPRVSWMKTAAPTAYTYQYDDPSSSFTCQLSGQKTSYQITYCPAGTTGAPVSA